MQKFMFDEWRNHFVTNFPQNVMKNSENRTVAYLAKMDKRLRLTFLAHPV